MKKNFKLVSFILLVVAVLVLGITITASAESDGLKAALESMKPITLRFGTNQAKSSVAFQGCQ